MAGALVVVVPGGLPGTSTFLVSELCEMLLIRVRRCFVGDVGVVNLNGVIKYRYASLGTVRGRSCTPIVLPTPHNTHTSGV